MRKLLVLSIGVLLLLLTSVTPSAHAQIWEPTDGPFQLGVGYQYPHYNVLGRTFHNNGVATTFAYHLFDPLTSASWRITAAVEGSVASGFGGNTAGVPPSLQAKSVFFGGGPHLTLESASRLQPWVHLLLGLDHLRFTQTATLGSKSAFGFIVGGGVDIRLTGPLYWRAQADYLGTHFQDGIESNYSFGTGIVLRF